jgi:hypothetical protein
LAADEHLPGGGCKDHLYIEVYIWLYIWSDKLAVSNTSQELTRREAERDAHVKSTMDSPWNLTQVLLDPRFSNWRPSSAAHSSRTPPLGPVRREPQAVAQALKSPATITGRGARRRIMAATPSRSPSKAGMERLGGA